MDIHKEEVPPSSITKKKNNITDEDREARRQRMIALRAKMNQKKKELKKLEEPEEAKAKEEPKAVPKEEPKAKEPKEEIKSLPDFKAKEETHKRKPQKNLIQKKISIKYYHNPSNEEIERDNLYLQNIHSNDLQIKNSKKDLEADKWIRALNKY